MRRRMVAHDTLLTTSLIFECVPHLLCTHVCAHIYAHGVGSSDSAVGSHGRPCGVAHACKHMCAAHGEENCARVCVRVCVRACALCRHRAAALFVPPGAHAHQLEGGRLRVAAAQHHVVGPRGEGGGTGTRAELCSCVHLHPPTLPVSLGPSRPSTWYTTRSSQWATMDPQRPQCPQTPPQHPQTPPQPPAMPTNTPATTPATPRNPLLPPFPPRADLLDGLLEPVAEDRLTASQALALLR